MLSMIEDPTQSAADGGRVFAPVLPSSQRLLLHGMIATLGSRDIPEIVAELRAMARGAKHDIDGLAFRAACLVLVDLIEQGWSVRLEEGQIRLQPLADTPRGGEAPDAVKARLRSALLVGRDRQLLEHSTQAFIRQVQQPRFTHGRQTSVTDLIDDGPGLAVALQQATITSCSDPASMLASVVDPTIVVCESNAACPVTGLPLIDIWRYFRHTWSTEYKPTPGRTLPLLIRNLARPNQPVIGIALLASAAPRLQDRDTWIGWLPEELRRRVYAGEWDPSEIGWALLHAVRTAITEIRSDDFEGIPAAKLIAPDEDAVRFLERQAAAASARRAADLRQREARPADSRSATVADRARPLRPDGTVDWPEASERPLFRAKRAQTLSRLLAALLAFQRAELQEHPGDALHRLLLTAEGRAALATALTEVRKRALASQIADVSVCGAVPPYNEVLGGKLVTLLLASQEVRDAYAARYAGQVSEIASRLAGRPIVRSAELLLLSTSSLYGVGSSQYNRLHLRASQHPGMSVDVRWVELGKTEGFGSSHLAPETVAVLRELSRAHHGARRVNNVFGEGTSPRLRQIREGLEALGIDSNQVLHHAARRILYACELVPSARAQLVGLPAPSTGTAPGAESIAAAWRRRWLLPRSRRPETLERLQGLGSQTIAARFAPGTESQLGLPL